VAALLRGDKARPAPAEEGDPAPDEAQRDDPGRVEREHAASATERSQEGDGGEPEASAPATAPASLADAAERLGIPIEKLYDVEIGTGDGETVRLGQLKDLWQDRERARAEIAEKSLEIDARETAIVADQRLWSELGEDLARTLPPHRMRELQDRLQDRQEREHGALMRAMPELRDQARFDGFRSDMVELLGRYGFKPHEMVMGDHRQLLILRDLKRARDKLAELAKFQPKRDAPGTRAGKGRGQGQSSDTDRMVARAKSSRNDADKVRGVSALLNR
jgi:hypothetical protein